MKWDKRYFQLNQLRAKQIINFSTPHAHGNLIREPFTRLSAIQSFAD